MMAETGIEFPLVEADAGETGLPDASFDLASPSTARRSGSTRTAGSPRRPVSCARAGGSSSCATRRSSCSAPATTSRPASRSQRPQFGMRRIEWPDGGVEFHLGARRVDRPAALERLRGRAADRAPGARRRRDASVLRTTSPPSGRASGRARRSGRSQARVSATPLVLASTSPQRRAILTQLRIPFEVVAPGVRGGARRRPARARRRQGALGRRRRRPVLGVDTIVVLRRRAARQAGRRGRGRADARARSPGGRTRSSPGSACARAAWEELHAETTRVTFRPLTPRDLGALPRDAASGRAAPARTRSRGSARRSSSGSRATT